ncbi:MAG TPA: hypothetical protein VF316_01010 [Polyangiaceae bacterium]
MAENEPRKPKHLEEVQGPDAPATEEELARAEALRVALDDASRPSEDAELLRALALAESPRALAEAAQDALVANALTRMDARKTRAKSDQRGVVVRVTFGAAALIAAAAAVVLVVGRSGGLDGGAKPELAHVRSTQALFDQPFERGQATARADRIAVARTADLRQNRFARWGVK